MSPVVRPATRKYHYRRTQANPPIECYIPLIRRPESRQGVEYVLSDRSPHQGQSVEFAEHKEYAPGDEIRHIDWKAYGKFDKYYVKKFEQETNLRAYLVVDAVIDVPWTRRAFPDRPDAFFVRPDAIANSVHHIVHQEPSGWTFELDLRPFAESW